MDNTTRITLALFALMIIGAAIPMVAADGNRIQYKHTAGVVTLETDDLSIRITGVGEVPHFHWWDPNATNTDYHVMFVKLFEANDTNGDGAFTKDTDRMIGPPFVLPTADWEFSGFKVDEIDGNATAVHFNFTRTENYIPRPGGAGGAYGSLPHLDPFDVTVQIRVHIDLTKANEMKFDLIISGWDWTYDTSLLVFQFTVTQSDHGQNQGTQKPGGFYQESTKFKFGNGYMEYEPVALAAQNQIEVKASHGEGTGAEAGESVYLAFENFGNETLVYDPTLGIESTGSALPLDANTLMVVGGVAVVIAVIAIVKHRR
ncbi:MAG: hypothetical protein HXY34_01780 [Candidatus Thorarchaeota archaeon]|nr:hypothetical protein [Candidatus Thorarchaeota archaeon]